MRKFTKGFTIIETLIGITLLAVIMGSILGAFIIVQSYFKDGVAMVNSQATARIVIEKMVRPYVREGKSFEVGLNGDSLEVTNYNSSILDPIIDTFTYVDDDGDEETFDDNRLERNGSIIGLNIVRILGTPIFQQIVANERVGINFGVKNEGIVGHFKEVHISTEMNLRN